MMEPDAKLAAILEQISAEHGAVVVTETTSNLKSKIQ